MKKLQTTCLIMVLFLLTGTHCLAQEKSLSVEKVDSCMRVSAKPMLMLLTTDWCKYCQLQKAQLRRNSHFQANADKFYFVEFDAEGKEPVTFHGRTYGYKATGVSAGIHELTMALAGDKETSYPAWVLLDKDYQVLFRYNGVLSQKQLNEIVKAIEKM